MIAAWQESYDKPRWCVRKQRHHFANKSPYSQGCGLSVVMYRKSWTIKKVENWRTDAFKLWCWRRLKSPLDSKEINLERNQPWIHIGRTDAEAGASILWPPDVNSLLTGKDSDAGKDWRKKEKRATEERWLDGITDVMDMNLGKLGDGEGQVVLQSMESWRVGLNWATEQQALA